MRPWRLNDVRLQSICKEYCVVLGLHIRTLHEPQAKDKKVDNANDAVWRWGPTRLITIEAREEYCFIVGVLRARRWGMNGDILVFLRSGRFSNRRLQLARA